jgi:hypothetical protein
MMNLANFLIYQANAINYIVVCQAMSSYVQVISCFSRKIEEIL